MVVEGAKQITTDINPEFRRSHKDIAMVYLRRTAARFVAASIG